MDQPLGYNSPQPQSQYGSEGLSTNRFSQWLDATTNVDWSPASYVCSPSPGVINYFEYDTPSSAALPTTPDASARASQPVTDQTGGASAASSCFQFDTTGFNKESPEDFSTLAAHKQVGPDGIAQDEQLRSGRLRRQHLFDDLDVADVHGGHDIHLPESRINGVSNLLAAFNTHPATPLSGSGPAGEPYGASDESGDGYASDEACSSDEEISIDGEVAGLLATNCAAGDCSPVDQLIGLMLANQLRGEA